MLSKISIAKVLILADLISILMEKMISLVESLGYFGIFIATVIEGTFVPIPNEITLIPAGYLVAKGTFNLWVVLAVSVIGNLTGSLISYYIALKYGRMLVYKYGKYLFFKEDKLKIVEDFFKKHGAFSVFLGRIMPGIKHFISFPAGLGKMDLYKFTLYTGFGGALWVAVLIFLGYFIGNNEDIISQYLSFINYSLIIGCIIGIGLYIYSHYTKRKKLNNF